MEKTPLSMRKSIAIFGMTNAGKSSLFNGLLGQEASIVSEVSGTTTDPVVKAMELVGYGPVTLIDTAGLSDDTILGEKRMEKTKEILQRVDLIILAKDITAAHTESIDFGSIPVIEVYTKCDTADKDLLAKKMADNMEAVFINGYTNQQLEELRKRIISELQKQQRDDETMLGDIVKSGQTVVMVIPIDSAAPKGRLILPQVQAIRDCLDNGITAVSVTPDLLKDTISKISDISLVVTDSQAFAEVSKIVPEEIPLTSFSMLLANQKGRIKQLIDGTKVIKSLEDSDEILMLEACTHSTTHEDIGRVKIPMLLQKKTGKSLKFTHLSGYDFPKDIERYKLVIQCGGCMINKRTIQNRLELLEQKGIPATNYGVVLAYCSGILERAAKVFINKD